MTTESKTPRTDAESYDDRDGRRTPYGKVVSVYFARTLELELSAKEVEIGRAHV